jgi:hypothetical protein
MPSLLDMSYQLLNRFQRLAKSHSPFAPTLRFLV